MAAVVVPDLFHIVAVAVVLAPANEGEGSTEAGDRLLGNPDFRATVIVIEPSQNFLSTRPIGYNDEAGDVSIAGGIDLERDGERAPLSALVRVIFCVGVDYRN